MGSYLSIDETALSKGELYTIITNKKARGKKGAIVAIFEGTKVEPIIEQLLKIPFSKRKKVKEITLDMANSMKIIVQTCFPKAIQVTDRFHVQKLALEALQNIRIKHRWDAIDFENEQIKQAREKKKQFNPPFFKMEIPENNYWQEADTYFTNLLIIGLLVKNKELKYYIINIQTSN